MIIYKITNLINNKIYIGVDSKNNPKYFGSGIIIKKAIRIYGKENFIKETIDTGLTKEELYKKEEYWVSYYNSTDRNIGYNRTPGGNGNCNTYKGKNLTKKHRKKISNGLKSSELRKQMWANGHGEKLSIARRKSEKVKALYLSEDWRKIISDSVKASEKYQKALSDPNRSKNIKKKQLESIKFKENNCNAVQQFDKNGLFIAEYYSTIEAHRVTGICRNTISRICRNKKMPKNIKFIWKFKYNK